jgi:dihydroflavonol-4-reductase
MEEHMHKRIESAFVTGATGLLGNNLVKTLLERGVRVKGLARDRAKADRQFAGWPVNIVLGDMEDIDGFAPALEGCDVLFHTAAHFRDSYKGGSHWSKLQSINVDASIKLVQAAHSRGLGRLVHASSIAVLNGPKGGLIDETMDRKVADADDYYRSKILSERALRTTLARLSDFEATFVLPGWMWGPGDLGPTSSGQLVRDFLQQKIPGVVPGSVSLVDARDVAQAMIAAAEKGRNGERYLAAGRHVTIADLLPMMERLSGIPAPTRPIPFALLYLLGGLSELAARTLGKEALLSLATVRVMAAENDRSRFDPAKSERELDLRFRPMEDTIRETIDWIRQDGTARASACGGPL